MNFVTIFQLAAISLVVVFAATLAFAIQRPCPTEDNTFCYWDASKRGNGAGNSFIDLGMFGAW